jgi:monofunctional biosynthetic peptidoglycan transglycosylase
LRWIVLIVLAVLLLPYLLTPLYRSLQPSSTLMLWRWITGARVQQVWMPLDRMSPALPIAVLIAEDARFCNHHGVDWGKLREAIDEADEFEDVRGASTITQQTVKNLFLWPGRSFVRKALEFPLTLWIELVLPKRRILEIYLNIAEWGPNGEFGAEAGARRAFGKSARDLSPNEATLLASVLPNPLRRNAQQPGPLVRRLAGIHAARAAHAGAVAACLRPQNGP